MRLNGPRRYVEPGGRREIGAGWPAENAPKHPNHQGEEPDVKSLT